MSEPAVVMLIEDNEDHAALIMEVLKNHKIVNQVLWFSNGESALEYLTREPRSDGYLVPNLILLDLKLPGMTGFDVLERIKSSEETKSIPIVILTTSYREEEVARGYELGANGYIVKPVDFEDFRAKMIDLKSYLVRTSELPK
jgi:two-component system response regulator